MEEMCKNCVFCKELYFPPSKDKEAKHEYCCTLFLVSENSVTYLGMDIKSLCECFTERGKHERSV